MPSRVNSSETRVPEVLAQIQETHEMPPAFALYTSADNVFPDSSSNNYGGKEAMLATIERIYSPMLKTMKLFGIYFGETSLKRMSSAFTFGRRRVSFSLLYCCVVVAIIWLHVAMAFTSLCMEGATDLIIFYLLLMSCSWSLITALSGTIFMVVLPLTEAKLSRFEKFIRALTECNADLKPLRSASRKSLIAAVLVSITSTLTFIIFFQFNQGLTLGVYKPWNAWSGFTFVSLISTIFSYGAWILPVPFFCMTCLVLERLFDDFCKRTLSKNPNSLDLKALKDEHRKLCGVAELASNMFSPLLLSLMSLYIPLMCFMFYVIVNLPSKVNFTVTLTIPSVFWLVISAGTVAVFLVFGSRVNEKINSFQTILEAVQVSDEDQVKLLALMFYLNGEPIGLSIGGLAVITKSLSVTIVGIIVSYCAVMLSLPS